MHGQEIKQLPVQGHDRIHSLQRVKLFSINGFEKSVCSTSESGSLPGKMEIALWVQTRLLQWFKIVIGVPDLSQFGQPGEPPDSLKSHRASRFSEFPPLGLACCFAFAGRGQ